MKRYNLVEEINLLSENMSIENKKYCDDLITYMRVKGFLKNEEDINEILLEILKDILDAQAQGVKAQDYFGKNPKEIADEILYELPIDLNTSFKILSYILIGYIFFMAIPSIIFSQKPLDVGNFLINAVFIISIALVIFYVQGRSVYGKKRKIYNLISIVVFIIAVNISITISNVVSTPLQISTKGWMGIGLILVSFFVLALLYYKGDENDKKMLLIFIPLVMSSGVAGIITRIEFFMEFTKTTEGKIFVYIAMLLLTLLQYFVIYRKMKKQNNIKKINI
ncbi:DUF1129 domain-containing protein [Peptostreptococcus faecalis]|uniref:hypothetical protein n=1 Tax=Peptostreptococcus faecalis TaxID=2045015 RepID=UPI000C7C9520|nr:hypothetical protein [Peptostreptococcus faecalis]